MNPLAPATTMPPTAFVPEVPHAQLQFKDVNIDAGQILPGDGYASYVKPFRTVEDIHVNAAILAYLVREARRLGWPRAWIERAVAVLLAHERLAGEDPGASETHVALAGALAIVAGLIGETEPLWDVAGADPAAQRWKRDRELLKVAGGIRAQRVASAWARLEG